MSIYTGLHVHRADTIGTSTQKWALLISSPSMPFKYIMEYGTRSLSTDVETQTSAYSHKHTHTIGKYNTVLSQNFLAPQFVFFLLPIGIILCMCTGHTTFVNVCPLIFSLHYILSQFIFFSLFALPSCTEELISSYSMQCLHVAHPEELMYRWCTCCINLYATVVVRHNW